MAPSPSSRGFCLVPIDMWPGVVLVEYNAAPIDYRWPLLGYCFLQPVYLLTVRIQIKIMGESRRPKLCAIGCYSDSIITAIYIFGHLSCLFKFIEEKLLNKANFLFAGVHLWLGLKQFWFQQSQNYLKSFFSTKS